MSNIPEQAAAETPMSDHVARFWQLLEAEHVRIRVDVRRETADGNDHYWDSSSFGDRLAKALVADRTRRARDARMAGRAMLSAAPASPRAEGQTNPPPNL